MADLRIAYTEKMVGSGHPTLSDTLNRLALVEHNNDGTHKALTQVQDPWIDVRAFGVTGDGITDDTAAIQSIIDTYGQAPSGGTYNFKVAKKIYFPPLIYKITGTININKSFLEFHCHGAVFNYTGTGKCFYIHDASPGVIYVNIYGAKIILNSDTANVKGIALGYARWCNIEAEVTYNNGAVQGANNVGLALERVNSDDYCYLNNFDIRCFYLGWACRLVNIDTATSSYAQANKFNLSPFLCGNGLYVKGCAGNEFNFINLELYTGAQTFLEFRQTATGGFGAIDNVVNIPRFETHETTNWNNISYIFDAKCIGNIFHIGRNAYGFFSIPVGNTVVYHPDYLRVENERTLAEEVYGGVAVKPNVLVNTEDFSDASWIKTNITVTANDATAPDGTATADKLTQTATGGYIDGQKTGLSAGDVQQRWTGSVWLKAPSAQICELKIYSDAYASGDQFTKLIPVTTEWKRFYVSGVFTLGTSYVSLSIRPSRPSGDGLLYAHAWGAQLQKGHLTAYQPNGGSLSQFGGGVVSGYGLLGDDIYLQGQDGTYTRRRVTYGTAAPTSGTWTQGDIVFNYSPAASGKIGWVCVTGGAPGTWKAFGAIDP